MEPIKDKSMGHTPSKAGQFLCNPVTDSRPLCSNVLVNYSASVSHAVTDSEGGFSTRAADDTLGAVSLDG
jgi:hypothetical protein